jgi:hypothetical protein
VALAVLRTGLIGLACRQRCAMTPLKRFAFENASLATSLATVGS